MSDEFQFLDYWLDKYSELRCPVCGTGFISRCDGLRKMNGMYADIKGRVISCLQCRCPLTPDWKVEGE